MGGYLPEENKMRKMKKHKIKCSVCEKEILDDGWYFKIKNLHIIRYCEECVFLMIEPTRKVENDK
jgi:late competence protein required for DNA uptake (superfamily II DNA/RNA helicase)